MQTANFDSEHFIGKLKNKNPEAMETLIRSNIKPLYLYAVGQGVKKDEAEDLVQSVWDSFFDAIDRFEGRSKVKTFLFGILVNKIREHKRRLGRIVDIPEDDQLENLVNSQFDDMGRWRSTPEDPFQRFNQGEIRKYLDICLKKIGEKYSTAFYLKEVEEENSEEICKIMNVSRTNLGVILFRAKNLLRKCLEKRALGIGEN